MLTLILQTQEGEKIELNVQPDDTFADLKSQYPDNDGLSDSLEQLITNGASVSENTRIFDYVTDSAHEWFSADHSVDVDDNAVQSATAETQIKGCCAQGCLNSDVTTPDKQFFPLPTDHDRLSMRLIEVGRPELYDQVLGSDAESSQKYFLCSSHFSQEASSLSSLCTAEQSVVSLLKPKNERMWTDTKEQIILNEEEQNDELQGADLDNKEHVLKLLNTVKDFEHPGILCRLCGEPTANPIHLYAREEENEEFGLADKINLCLPVTVTITDPLPKQICEECQSKLNTCHELALSSLQTEDKFKFLLREKKLCVNGTTEQQCPLCLEGDMQIVKKSGIYSKDDLKNEFCCSANKSEAAKSTSSEKIVSTEDCNDLSLGGINLPLLDDSISELTATDYVAKAQQSNENILPPLSVGIFRCSNCSAKINVVSIRTHECSPENGNSPYGCLIKENTNIAYPHEPEVHYQHHSLLGGKFTCNSCRYECEELEEAAEHVKTCNTFAFWEVRCETYDKAFPNTEPINDHQCYQISSDPHELKEDFHTGSPKKLPRRQKKQRSYKCQYCQKQFNYEVALVKHIRIHTGERPYKCSICGKGFAQSSGLNTHVKIHSDVRPYSCPKCPRTFKIKGDCDNHVKRHSGIRPYKCEFCSKAFMTQHVFSQHRRIHTNDRPYKCDVCGVAFRRSHVLTVHRRIHTGEKPHVCDLCPKTYRQRGDLVKHKKIQHGFNATTVAKLNFADNCSENSYDPFAKSNSKIADGRDGNSLLLLPL